MKYASWEFAVIEGAVTVGVYCRPVSKFTPKLKSWRFISWN